MGFERFSNREVRIKRREERNLFRRKLLPVAWLFAALGAAGLCVIGIYYALYNEWLYQFLGLALALAVLPLVLTALGWLRGHHSSALDEP